MYDGSNGLVVLTDRRVIFTSAGIANSRFEDFSYDRISSVQHTGGLMLDGLTIFASGNKAELKSMLKDRAKEIGEYIRRRISDPSAVAPPLPEAAPPPSAEVSDPLERLRKLGELRDAGVVSPEEFEEKKRKLLGEI